MTKSKNDIKQQRAALLGMPYGTAEKHLRKAVIYELARQSGKILCRWCGTAILSPNDLAVVHIQDWSGDADLFWDLNNVAFSHVSCAAERGGIQQEVKMERIKVTVIDEHGNNLPGTNHGGQLYVAGQEGQRYQIRIKNTTGRRILVVPTVDGRNVLSGQPGTFSDRGYILLPYGSMDVDGWRQTEETVAAFVFGKRADSYSAQKGSPENVGVIGVAVFEEAEKAPQTVTHVYHHHYPKYPERPWYPWVLPQIWMSVTSEPVYGSEVQCNVGATSTIGNASVVNNANASSGILQSASLTANQSVSQNMAEISERSQEIGTEYGQSIASAVKSDFFLRATQQPCEIHEVRYDTLESLTAAGILGIRPSQKSKGPSAFPQEPTVSPGYCQPPERLVNR